MNVVALGKMRDDGTLNLPLTSKMLGRCVMFVYSTQNQQMTDMMQFYVTDSCQVHI